MVVAYNLCHFDNQGNKYVVNNVPKAKYLLTECFLRLYPHHILQKNKEFR